MSLFAKARAGFPYPKTPGPADQQARSGEASYSPLLSQTSDPDKDIERRQSDTPSPATRRPNTTTVVRLALESLIALLLILLLYTLYTWTPQTYGNDRRITSGPFAHPRKFGNNVLYNSLQHTEDQLWAEYFLEGYPEFEFPPYDPQTGHAIDHRNSYGSISMFHSLHCLSGIRRAIQELADGSTTLAKLQRSPHVPHCFDYLRQGILCFADDTWERPRDGVGTLNGDRGGGTISGYFDTHVCRDYTRLEALAEEFGNWKRGTLNRTGVADTLYD